MVRRVPRRHSDIGNDLGMLEHCLTLRSTTVEPCIRLASSIATSYSFQPAQVRVRRQLAPVPDALLSFIRPCERFDCWIRFAVLALGPDADRRKCPMAVSSGSAVTA